MPRNNIYKKDNTRMLINVRKTDLEELRELYPESPTDTKRFRKALDTAREAKVSETEPEEP